MGLLLELPSLPLKLLRVSQHQSHEVQDLQQLFQIDLPQHLQLRLRVLDLYQLR